jgi:hypothetical protein
MKGAPRFLAGILACTCVLATLTLPLRAQSGAEGSSATGFQEVLVRGIAPLSSRSGCTANIPSTSMHRVPVFLSASVMRQSDSAFSLQAELLAQDVAAELRSMLGGSDSAITVQDDRLPWYSVPTTIVVAARKNGEMSANQFAIGGDSTATLLLLEAFKKARAQGGAMMAWPDGFAKDTVWVRLDLWPNYVNAVTKRESAVGRGGGFPTFSLTEPEEGPATPLPTTTRPKYPPSLGQTRYSGTVLMQLTVDAAGRTKPATIHDLWPEGKARLQGRDGEAYDAFVSSIASWIATVRFQPAHLGSCARSQMVTWPFEFKIPGAR